MARSPTTVRRERGGIVSAMPAPDFITDSAQSAADPDKMSDIQLVAWVAACRNESADAMKERLRLNRRNRDANMGKQDWSHKVKGQSREFLPRVRMAGEQFSAFTKRALTQFGQWFQVDQRTDMPGPLREEKISELMLHILNNIYIGNGRTTKFSTILSDGVKLSLFESLIVLKISGEFCPTIRRYVDKEDAAGAAAESIMPGQDMAPGPAADGTGDNGGPPLDGEAYPGTEDIEQSTEMPQPAAERKDVLKTKTIWPWKLRVDLIRPDAYFPDPSGRGLYEIHEIERDLFEVVDMAEKGIYDSQVVAQIHSDYMDEEEAEKERRAKGQQNSTPPAGRKRVRIREFWGNILNHDGLIEHRNVVMAVANERYLIRPPEENPFWHGTSPFLAIPLVRTPLSVHHSALYDDAVALNLVQNELFNLILDGGLESVWGVRQVRVDDMDDPEDISNGISSGMTIRVKSTLPHNAKVVERVTEGSAPQDALAVFEMLGREFNQAALTNDVKLGTLPMRQVTATEVNDATNSSNTTLDAIASDLENELLTPALTKIFLTVMQHMEWMDAHEVVGAIGPAAAFSLAKMTPPQRYAAFAYPYNFKVFGLSAVMTRARDFQRLMALLQAVMSNPILLQSFIKIASGDKLLKTIMKMLNINPDSIAITPEEQQQLPQTMQEVQSLTSITNPTSGGGRADGAGTAGGSNTSAEINQMENPLSGMGGG